MSRGGGLWYAACCSSSLGRCSPLPPPPHPAVYIWQDRLRSQLYGSWDPDEFVAQHLERYTAMCERFAADVAAHRQWKDSYASSPDAGDIALE